MEKTLLAGDVIVVNKLTYGPRLPITPIGIPFLHQSSFFGSKPYLSFVQLPYFRLSTSTNIERNDVIVFNYPADNEHPVDHKPLYVKRCIGKPGDQFKMINKKVFINQQAFADTVAASLYSYRIKTSIELDNKVLKELGITEGGMINSKLEYQFEMSRKTAKELKKIPGVLEIKELMEVANNWKEHVFPFDHTYPWNKDNSGPLYIPAKGDRIQLTANNISKYHRIIASYEDNDVRVMDDSILINDKVAAFYEFKMNYYYVLGDNRDNSSDSRYWGLIPEDHIIGKASRVIYSFDKSNSILNKFRWSRFFKSIN